MLKFIFIPISFLIYYYRKKLYLLSQIIWYKTLHSCLLNKFIEHKNNKVILSYVINGHLHKFVVDNKRGPNLIYSIKDENNIDMSEIACFDFNNLTPDFWNKKKLIFEMLNGKVFSFSENEVINLNQK